MDFPGRISQAQAALEAAQQAVADLQDIESEILDAMLDVESKNTTFTNMVDELLHAWQDYTNAVHDVDDDDDNEGENKGDANYALGEYRGKKGETKTALDELHTSIATAKELLLSNPWADKSNDLRDVESEISRAFDDFPDDFDFDDAE